MKLPRVECEACGRSIAAGPVAGRLGKGRLWRHDPPDMRALHPDALVSCHGSLSIVDLPYGQLEIPVETPGEAGDGREDPAPAPAPVLF